MGLFLLGNAILGSIFFPQHQTFPVSSLPQLAQGKCSSACPWGAAPRPSAELQLGEQDPRAASGKVDLQLFLPGCNGVADPGEMLGEAEQSCDAR